MKKLWLVFLTLNLVCSAYAQENASGINSDSLKPIALCEASKSKYVVGEHNFIAPINPPLDFPQLLKSSGLEDYIYSLRGRVEKTRYLYHSGTHTF